MPNGLSTNMRVKKLCAAKMRFRYTMPEHVLLLGGLRQTSTPPQLQCCCDGPGGWRGAAMATAPFSRKHGTLVVREGCPGGGKSGSQKAEIVFRHVSGPCGVRARSRLSDARCLGQRPGGRRILDRVCAAGHCRGQGGISSSACCDVPTSRKGWSVFRRRPATCRIAGRGGC